MFTLAQFVSLTSALERKVGVKVGDWVKYGDFVAIWNSTDPNIPPSPGLAEINETEWSVNTVQNISGTRITFQTVNHYKNGTETKSVAHIDVATGEGNGTYMFISSGLSAGHPIYASAEFQDTWINKTVSRSYLGVTRETNYIKLGILVEPGYVWMLEFCWDKETGILTEWVRNEIFAGEDFTATSSVAFRIVDTNLWTSGGGAPPSQFPLALVLVIFVVAFLFLLVLKSRK